MDQRRQLLLIEDDKIDREKIQRLLDDGYQVHHAATGRQALEMLQEGQPLDGILLDYYLPDIDGLKLLDQLVKLHLPVIILTGESDPAIIIEVMKRGAEDYLFKEHLSKEALEYTINNAIEQLMLKRDLHDKHRQLAEQAALLEIQHQKIRTLASKLTLAEQRERNRIAQILHDDLQQTIYGIQVQKHLIEMNASPDSQRGLKPHLEIMEHLIDQAIEVTRSLAVTLSPPVQRSDELAPVLGWLASKMNEIHKLSVKFEVRGECRVPNEDLRLLLFQLTRELLFNVVKHASVDEARLVLFEEDDQIFIRVDDSGLGFDAEAVLNQPGGQGFGLYSVRERLELFGGRLEIDSSPDQGSRLLIIVPKNPEPWPEA